MNNCHEHGAGHESHGHGMGHGSAASFLRRFWIVTFLLIPLILTNEAVVTFLGLPSLTLSKWVAFAIATVIFGFSLIFFQHAWHEIQARQYGMMTLVSLAVAAGYLFSVASTIMPALDVEFYLEISTLIWVLLFGHYLEAKSGAAAGNALQEVAKLLPKEAHKLVDGKEQNVAVDRLAVGDVVRVKPGEKVPADGTITSGSASVNEAHVSGESKPIDKQVGDAVVAGSICLDGSLVIELSRVGAHSTVGQIESLIRTAEGTKPRSQRLADRAAGILTFVAGISALLTLIVWSVVLGETFVFAMTLAITVLVIACPHALGLAIPTVTTITTSLAVKNGFFIKNLAKIEVLNRADYVVFDKTGTLTTGEFGVADVVPFGDYGTEDILSLAASLEQHSSHIIGQAIVAAAADRSLELASAADFKNHSGKGIVATIDGQRYVVGNEAMLTEVGLTTAAVADVYQKLSAEGQTTVFVANESAVIGLIALADSVHPSARETVSALHKRGVKVAMLTGDSEAVAKATAKELGIDTYFAEVLPEAKYEHIRTLQSEGSTVVMVGDGVNDAPALTQADVGVAIGAGTDIAVEAGDVVLTESDPADIVRLLTLAKKVYHKMIQNLVWALGYNIIAIPAAAGAFAYWGFFLRPEVGAFIMSLSTVIVVINAMLLKRVDLG